LNSTRKGYDSATSKAAVLAAQKALSVALPGVQKRIDKIDHWGVNSKLLADYAALLQLLSDRYPAARIQALAGDSQQLDAARAELEARMKTMTQWLADAEEAEDE
jgi:hypothetical protein